ncbi:hypothetical protein DV737_g2538, partial [Chaetothyriales sp. CBS 132003]
MAPPRVAIIYYSLYGHVAELAKKEAAGVAAAGGKADIYQIKETLPAEVIEKMHAKPQDTSIPFVTPQTLTQYDAFLFGIPTRYGNYSAQWKTFIDQLGQLWSKGALQGGGQESTAIAALSSWVHQGLIYVPLGYANAFPILGDLSEVRGGSPWGAGTFASGDGSRQPTEKELQLAEIQGKSFYETVSKVSF